MIRPCDRCGGTGWTDPYRYEGDDGHAAVYVGTICPRCAKMPLLHVVHLEPLDIEEMTRQGRMVFRPDPTTVVGWCNTHLSTVGDGDDRCHYSCCWDSWQNVDPDCEIVWVEKPTPLEEIER